MKDISKTKSQLIYELELLRRRVSALKKHEIDIEQAKDGAVIVFNARSVPEYAKGDSRVKTGFVDATRIAQECGLVKSGTPLVNVAMLGAWAKSAKGLISLDALCKSVEKTYGKGDLAERNIKSVRQAYDEFQFEE